MLNKDEDLLIPFNGSNQIHLDEPDQRFQMNSKKPFGDEIYHMNESPRLDTGIISNSKRKRSLNPGVAVNIGHTIGLASSKFQEYNEELEKRDRLQSHQFIDPNYTTEDLENEPQSKIQKFEWILLLFFMMFLNFSCWFAYDFPQLFESQLLSKFNINALQLSYTYAIYSVPNFIFAPIISILLNYSGLGFGGILLNTIIFSSGFLLYFGCRWDSFFLVLVSRALLGIGGESILVAQAAIAERWFTGKFLSLAIGMNNVVSLLGTALAAWLGPEIYVGKRDIQWVIFVITLVGFIVWFMNVGYWLIEERLIKREKDLERVLQEHILEKRIADLKEGDNINDCLDAESSKTSTFKTQSEAKFTFRHIGHLGKLFWMLTIVFAFVSMAYFQFTNFVTDLLMQRYKYPYLKAKNLVALIPVATIILIPIFSSIIVVIGKKGYALLISAIVGAGVYWYMEIMPPQPSVHVTYCILGVAFFYSLYSSVIWSSITLVVPQQGTSVALGLATTIQNILMTTLPLYFGRINKSRSINAYNMSLFSLRILAFGGIFASLLVILVDFRTGKRLHLHENHKEVLEAKSLANQKFKTGARKAGKVDKSQKFGSLQSSVQTRSDQASCSGNGEF